MNTRTPITRPDGTVANHVAFNNNSQYFCVALDTGFSSNALCNCCVSKCIVTDEPIKVYTSESCELYLEQELAGSVRLASMMESSQIVAVLMAENRHKAGDRLVLWDTAKGKEVAAITTAKQIRNIALTKTHIVTIFDSSVVVYKHQPKIERIAQYETSSNPLGLCCLGHRLLVIPGRSTGQIQIIDLATQTISIIPAHTTPLYALKLSSNEEVVASASEQGTLVRLYSSGTCARLGELRRGVTTAKIFSVAISPSGSRLAVTSDTNTLHIFQLPGATSSTSQRSRKGSSSSTDTGSTKNASRPSSSQGGFQKWGGLAKLPFAPRVFTDTYSFASATFDPGKDDQISDFEPIDTETSTRVLQSQTSPPKGVAGWIDDETIAVVNAGSDARYERFAMLENFASKTVCVRVGWSRYLVPG